MNRMDWEAMFLFIGAFGYVTGTLFGYMASLFHITYGWVLVPIWFGMGYFVIKHRQTYKAFFRAMWSGRNGKEKGE
jgi:hypothetical protein